MNVNKKYFIAGDIPDKLVNRFLCCLMIGKLNTLMDRLGTKQKMSLNKARY